MEKNNTGKYFKYAIGEIILVVIGILIALQINNWNEEKQDRKIDMAQNSIYRFQSELRNHNYTPQCFYRFCHNVQNSI